MRRKNACELEGLPHRCDNVAHKCLDRRIRRAAKGTVSGYGNRGDDMSSIPRTVDLTQVPAVPWAWVDEHMYAAIRGCSVKVLQRERRLNIGCRFARINGTSIRYKMGDITAFLESQPGGGGGAVPNPENRGRAGRPRRCSTLTVGATEVMNGVVNGTTEAKP